MPFAHEKHRQSGLCGVSFAILGRSQRKGPEPALDSWVVTERSACGLLPGHRIPCLVYHNAMSAGIHGVQRSRACYSETSLFLAPPLGPAFRPTIASLRHDRRRGARSGSPVTTGTNYERAHDTEFGMHEWMLLEFCSVQHPRTLRQNASLRGSPSTKTELPCYSRIDEGATPPVFADGFMLDQSQQVRKPRRVGEGGWH